MNPVSIVWTICQLYVRDLQGQLPTDMHNTLSGWIRSRAVVQLSSCSSLFHPDYHGEIVLRALLQLEAFVKKNQVFTDAEKADVAAWDSFYKSERINRITNKRLNYFYSHPDRLDPDIAVKVRRVQSWIADVLGPFKSFEGELPELVRVTGGASAQYPRSVSLPYRKVSRKIPCRKLAEYYIKNLGSYFGYDVLTEYVNWNRLAAVPKNWKTSRLIACEAEGNQSLQLTVDTYLKPRLHSLKRIDLRNQFYNQELARIGSLDGSFATIDLANASNSVTINAVCWLFPSDWYEFVDGIRSVYAFMPNGQRHQYSMFSSMGNGTTFVIETLIFAAICSACGCKYYQVYGDDIAIETEFAPDVLQLLKFFGFSTNSQKTFVSGPFRESCGTNWFKGVDITPFYIREIDGRKTVLSHLVNGIVSIAEPYGFLASYMVELTKEFNLAVCPYNEDTMSGVHVTVGEAYKKKVLRTKRYRGDVDAGCVQAKLYVQCSSKPHTSKKTSNKTATKKEELANPRKRDGWLFLWHLEALHRKPIDGTALVRRVSNRKIALENARQELEHRNLRAEASGHVIEKPFYRLQWMPWFYPRSGVPSHLFWWEDLLNTQKESSKST